MNTMRDALCVTEAGKALVVEVETVKAKKQAFIDLADSRVKAFSQFLYDTIVRHAPKGYSRDYLYNLYRSARCSTYYICFHERAPELLESVEQATKYMWDNADALNEIKTWIREPARYVSDCV